MVGFIFEKMVLILEWRADGSGGGDRVLLLWFRLEMVMVVGG